MSNKQTNFWTGKFGKEYNDRNNYSHEEWERFYINNWGITKTKMNESFIGDLPKDIRILEVGSNIGMQLRGLQQMGFINLYGIELQSDAVEKSKQQTKGINIIQGSGYDIPYKDSYFDLVFTAGVLIHIAPENYKTIMSEMVRCSKKYIWGFEYFSENITDIPYRDNIGFLWKADFSKIFLQNFSQLKEVKRHYFKYVNSDNVDCMYLLEK